SYDTLGRLARQGCLFNVVFVTDRFFEQVEADKERGTWHGWTHWTDDARRFVSTVSSIPTLKPPTFDLNLAKVLLDKITAIYIQAFGGVAPPNFQRWTLDTWQRTTTRSVRLLVRLAIDALDSLDCR